MPLAQGLLGLGVAANLLTGVMVASMGSHWRRCNGNGLGSPCSASCRPAAAFYLSGAGACSWVAAFVGWYNDQHRHSGIRFVTPSQHHSGKAIEICRHRARVYELARQLHPLRWTGTTRYWHQPEVVWINPPPPEIGIN